MLIKKSSVTYPDTLKALLIKNLRLPSDIATDDDSLILSNLKSAIDYIENVAKINITTKTVTQVWSSRQNKYVLVYQPESVTSIKINAGTDIKGTASIYKDTSPAFFFLPETSYADGDNVIQVEYECEGDDICGSVEQLVIAVASIYYNNPEGLPQNDQRKVQMLLNNYLNII
jgi:hypothetical protein